MEKQYGPDLTELVEIEFDEKRQARRLPSNQQEHHMTKPSLTAVIRMAQSVAQREVQSPNHKNLSLIHISGPTRHDDISRMPSSA
jgi:hypothetical protein